MPFICTWNKYSVRVWTLVLWLRTRNSGKVFWVRQYTFDFRKRKLCSLSRWTTISCWTVSVSRLVKGKHVNVLENHTVKAYRGVEAKPHCIINFDNARKFGEGLAVRSRVLIPSNFITAGLHSKFYLNYLPTPNSSLSHRRLCIRTLRTSKPMKRVVSDNKFSVSETMQG